MLGHGPTSSGPIGALPDEIDLSPPKLNGDAAKTRIEEDEFGLLSIVQSIKEVVRSRVTANGYALGIEGRWGSGKSTLLNFVEEALRSDADGYQKVIRFDPWLIGDKRTLLRFFLIELSRTIEEFRNDARVREKVGKNGSAVLDRLVPLIDQYSSYIEAASSTADAVTVIDPTLYAGVVSSLLKAVVAVGKFFKKKPPGLDDLKGKITDDLQVLKNLLPGISITVLIDDTDRLDPSESVEILRLIKAVANFPVVIYLVCFDIKILASQVHRVIQVGDGADYLEKIFQQIVPLPPQEPFSLRRFVRKNLTDCFSEAATSTSYDLEIRERDDAVYDQWIGKLIETPRDAIRLCENVKFGWPYLRGKGDFLDYVWLQLVKLKNPDLYQWTRDYVTGLGSYRDGGRPGDTTKADAEKLSAILSGLGWSEHNYRSRISLILPGVKFVHLDAGKRDIFHFDPTNELDLFEAQSRLGSPSHWRYYFAFDKPSYALGDGDLSEFRSLSASHWEDAAEFLRALTRKPHRVSHYYLDVLLDRLKDSGTGTAPGEQIGMAWAFASMMDEIPRGGDVQFRSSDPWRSALKLLGPEVSSQISSIAAAAASVNWLALVLRDQGYALKLKSSGKADSERSWLTQDQWEYATSILISRFRMMGIAEILSLPEPLQVFFCWHDFDEEEIRKFVAESSNDNDQMFVAILFGLLGWMNSSESGIGRTLSPETVKLFMDDVAAKGRLEWLEGATDTPDHIRKKVSTLLDVWDSPRGGGGRTRSKVHTK